MKAILFQGCATFAATLLACSLAWAQSGRAPHQGASLIPMGTPDPYTPRKERKP